MGVSGCGKSTVANGLAAYLHCPYKDGDSLHPASNIHKMESGHPLTDEDRIPWLKSIRDYACSYAAVSGDSKSFTTRPLIVLACSALKKSYRDLLRDGTAEIVFVYLEGSKDLLTKRMTQRTGHFMKTSMLESQLEALEDPKQEGNVLTVSIEAEPTRVIKDACEQAQSWLATS